MRSFGARLMSKFRGKPNADPGAVMDLIEMRTLRTEQRTHLEAMVRARTGYAAIAPDAGLARVLGRYKMYVAPDDDAISSHLIMDGFWEMWNTIFLAGFIRQGWTVLEVGAHLGYFGLLMSDLVGPTGRLIGFEPVRRNGELLRRSLAVNGFAGRYTLEQKAVSDSNRMSRVHVPRGNWGGGSIVGAPSHDVVASEDVPSVTLDSYCSERNIQPDFIKIDAEASERQIWNGMSGLISRQQKFAVLMEFDVIRYANWSQWLAEIEGQGFKLYRIGEDSKPLKISPSMAPPNGIIEILCLKGYSDRS